MEESDVSQSTAREERYITHWVPDRPLPSPSHPLGGSSHLDDDTGSAERQEVPPEPSGRYNGYRGSQPQFTNN